MACKQELWDEAKKNHKGMEELLDENYFVRVHQSFLINMKYIKSIKRNEVLLSNGMKFDIPRARYKGVEEKFVMYKGLI